ncbi:hypothetical protein RFF05_07970 [Bengtsoniella intestinalis]|uniref:hypothetical protein n=1 Tax=Bengtsoniella intestinalis TaxID=3073143 RepID=UPI00391EFA7E
MIIEKVGAVMIHLDLKSFQNNMKKAKASKEYPKQAFVDTSINEVNEHLLFHLVKPSLLDQSVCFGDLDFDAFDTDDIEECGQLLDYLACNNTTALGMWFALKSQAPEALKIRAFC